MLLDVSFGSSSSNQLLPAMRSNGLKPQPLRPGSDMACSNRAKYYTQSDAIQVFVDINNVFQPLSYLLKSIQRHNARIHTYATFRIIILSKGYKDWSNINTGESHVVDEFNKLLFFIALCFNQ